MSALISLLVTLIVLAIVFAIVYAIVRAVLSLLGLGDPFNKIVYLVMLLVALLVVLNFLGAFGGAPLLGLGFGCGRG